MLETDTSYYTTRWVLQLLYKPILSLPICRAIARLLKLRGQNELLSGKGGGGGGGGG